MTSSANKFGIPVCYQVFRNTKGIDIDFMLTVSFTHPKLTRRNQNHLVQVAWVTHRTDNVTGHNASSDVLVSSQDAA